MTEAYELRNLIEAEQTDFAAMLRELTPEQWAVPSLCEGWTVHDVVLHIAWHTHNTDVARVAQLFKARNSEARMHAAEAARPKDALIDRLVSPATLAGPSNMRTQLTELVLHQQDVRRPLGIERSVPEERLLVVLDFSLTRSGGSAALASARKRARGLRLVATDLPWSAGVGREVRGPGEALCMALNGRTGAVDQLTGEGLPVLAGRIKT
jgi:uncharacterized protein (TIGR03083 family)